MVSAFACLVLSAFCVGPDSRVQQDVIELPQMQARVAAVRERVTELAGTDDLLDTLHFEWFDRPYARATLAVLVKTTRVLDREMHLRGLGNGAIPDSALVAALSWAENALGRVVSPEPHTGFRPHRLRIASADILTPIAAPPLFAFVDDTTATRHDRRFGDLDLLVAAGWRVYPKLLGSLRGAGVDGTLFDRANALGIIVVGVRAYGETLTGGAPDLSAESPDSRALLVQSLLLGNVLNAAFEAPFAADSAIALVDLASRESLGGWLARRGRARGLRGGTRYLIDSWQAPAMGESPDNRAAATAAAMWIDALEGQSLGLTRGWRDLRDGSGSLCPSVFVEPWYIETVAHTALDIIRLSSYVGRFHQLPILVVWVGPDAVDEHNDNAWAAWTNQVWDTLLQRQVRFDVVAGSMRADGQSGVHHRVILPVHRPDLTDRNDLLVRIDRTLADDSVHAKRISVLESDGSPAAEVFLREAQIADAPRCVALVNLSNRPRMLKLRGDPPLRAATDLIAPELIRTPEKLLALAPWQVRLMCPEE